MNKAIQNFCKFYEVEFTEKMRFTITKRKFIDKLDAENFKEDWPGEAKYKETFVLVEVSHYNARYNASLVNNSLTVKQYGLETFMKKQQQEFKCDCCGVIISLQDTECSECKKKR